MSALISTETQQWEGHQVIRPFSPSSHLQADGIFVFKDHTRTYLIFIEMFLDVFIATDLKLIELCFAKVFEAFVFVIQNYYDSDKIPPEQMSSKNSSSACRRYREGRCG